MKQQLSQFEKLPRVAGPQFTGDILHSESRAREFREANAPPLLSSSVALRPFYDPYFPNARALTMRSTHDKRVNCTTPSTLPHCRHDFHRWRTLRHDTEPMRRNGLLANRHVKHATNFSSHEDADLRTNRRGEQAREFNREIRSSAVAIF